MILNKEIINMIKDKSGLSFDKAKDYDSLCDLIFSLTARTIGVNTVKRLMGYIVDDRKSNEYTLNTIAIYLGFKSWGDLCNSVRIDSEWNFDNQTVYVADLAIGEAIAVKYLDRYVKFKVVIRYGNKMLEVIEARNSSLQIGDVLEVEQLRIGQILEAKTVFRGESIGNYRTNGELKEIITE